MRVSSRITLLQLCCSSVAALLRLFEFAHTDPFNAEPTMRIQWGTAAKLAVFAIEKTSAEVRVRLMYTGFVYTGF